MKKSLFLFLIFMLNVYWVSAQIKIHSHNDYEHEKPFIDAVGQGVFSIEADIFVAGDTLFVAHSRREIKPGNTLESIYLKPIKDFSKSKEFYCFQLMIDVKDDWNITYPVLLKYLNRYKKSFNKHGKQISIVISGNRPPDSTFKAYPEIIMFDGIFGRAYDQDMLNKIAMISGNFKSFSKWKGVGAVPEVDKQKLLEAINYAHKMGKPCRFWNAPDTEASWDLLKMLGVDIINTDKVEQATKHFKTNN